MIGRIKSNLKIKQSRNKGKNMKRYVVFLLLLMYIGIVSAGDLVGKTAPGFSGKDIDGKEINLSDYKGKVVLLDFWASWCIPCREEFPFLVDFYREHQKDPFMVLAVSIDDKEENMRNFLKKNYASHVFPVIFDRDKSIPPLYELESMPTSIFIDKKGIIRYIHTGFNDTRKKEFQTELSTLLREE